MRTIMSQYLISALLSGEIDKCHEYYNVLKIWCILGSNDFGKTKDCIVRNQYTKRGHTNPNTTVVEVPSVNDHTN